MSQNYVFDYTQQVFCFEGKEYRHDELETFKQYIEAKAESSQSLIELYDFLQQWFNSSETVTVATSGSTGVAKQFLAQKKRMMESAKRTCSFLGLNKAASVLLCMPLQFIGAKMIVVRALIAGLDLYYVTPSLHPMQDIPFSPDFVAMTPQQAVSSLTNPVEKQRLQGVKNLLLGGMAVSNELQKELQDFPHAVWLSYGMTETLSHIALRRLNGEGASPYFTPFSDVELSLSEQDTLCINAPSVCDTALVTNDIAELLPDGRFHILGRVDNVVNSGGIKIQIEEVEAILSSAFSIPFQLSSIPHPELGEELVLLTASPCDDWKERCSVLPKHKKPKLHILLPELPLTGSGKPDRHTAKKLAQQYQ